MGDKDDFSPDYSPKTEEGHEPMQGSSQAPTGRAVPKSRGMVQERFYVGEAAQLKL